MPVTVQEGHVINGKIAYARSVFDPAAAGLQRKETEVMLALIPALRATDTIYFTQNGGRRNHEMWRALSTVSGETDSLPIWEYGAEMAYRGSLFGRGMDKVKPRFSMADWEREARKVAAAHVSRRDMEKDVDLYDDFARDEEPPKGANVFVNETDMDNETFTQWCQRAYDDVWRVSTDPQRFGRTHPILSLTSRVVVRGREGEYRIEATPWNLYEETQRPVGELTDSLWAAGKVCEKELHVLSDILKATAVGVQTGNFDARDILLPRNDSKQLYVLGGITEEYVGSKRGWEFAKQGGFDLLMAVQSPEIAELANKARPLIPKFVQDLPADLRNDHISDIVVHGINEVMLAGDSGHATYTISARNWPNSQLLKDVAPYVVIHVGGGTAVTKYLEMPAAKALLPEEHVLGGERVALNKRYLVLLHEFCHTVGKRVLYDAVLEEGRATAGALWYFPRFAESVGGGQALVDEFFWSTFPRTVRAIKSGCDLESGAVFEQHAIGENVMLNMMLEDGAVEVSNGKVAMIKPQQAAAAAGRYFVEATRLQRFGTPEEISRFLEPHRVLRGPVKALITTAKEAGVPEGIYVDHGSIDTLEARLRAYLKSLK